MSDLNLLTSTTDIVLYSCLVAVVVLVLINADRFASKRAKGTPDKQKLKMSDSLADTLQKQNDSLQQLYKSFTTQNQQLRGCLDSFQRQTRTLESAILKIKDSLGKSYRENKFFTSSEALKGSIDKLKVTLKKQEDSVADQLKLGRDTANSMEDKLASIERLDGILSDLKVYDQCGADRVSQLQQLMCQSLDRLSERFVNEMSHLSSTVSSKVLEPYINASQFFDHTMRNTITTFHQTQDEMLRYLDALKQNVTTADSFASKLAALEEGVHKISSANMNLAAVVLDSLQLLKNEKDLAINYHGRPLNVHIKRLAELVAELQNN